MIGYFVMMYSQDGKTAMPILEGNKENAPVMFWDSEEDAHEDMINHPYASAFGYEVFEI